MSFSIMLFRLYWKKGQTVFNNCNITVQYLLYIQNIKKCMYTGGLWWEDTGKNKTTGKVIRIHFHIHTSQKSDPWFVTVGGFR